VAQNELKEPDTISRRKWRDKFKTHQASKKVDFKTKTKKPTIKLWYNEQEKTRHK
jgi:aryl carrier-like protein